MSREDENNHLELTYAFGTSKEAFLLRLLSSQGECKNRSERADYKMLIKSYGTVE